MEDKFVLIFINGMYSGKVKESEISDIAEENIGCSIDICPAN